MATKRKTSKRRKTSHKVGAISRKRTMHHTAKKHTTRRRSKVGAVSMTGEIILGAIGGSLVTRLIMKNLPDPMIDSKTGAAKPDAFDYRPFTGLAVGAAAEYFGKKNLLIKSMGIGAIVEGARAIITDKYIPSLSEKTAAVKGLPYTATLGANRKRMMGIGPGSLAGKQPPMLSGNQNSTQYSALAGTSGNHFMYDTVM